MDKKYRRSTIYFGDGLKRLLTDDSVNQSARINQVADRYMLVCRYHGLNLSESEEQVLILAFKGKKVTSDIILDCESHILEASTSESAHILLNKIKESTLADFVGTLDDLKL